MYYLKLYVKFIVAHLQSKMEYKFSFFSDILVQIITYSIHYFNIWILLNKFGSMQGWSFYEIVFLYNMNLFTYGVSALFVWEPMRELENMVQEGSFDSILTKPINPFLHLVFRQFRTLYLGHTLLGIIVFYICLSNLPIHWDIYKAIWFVIVLAGGVLIQAAVMILGGAVSFWIVKSKAVIDTGIYGLRFFLNYPISIYDIWVQVILTFIIPYAFVNFYPAQYFLSKESTSLFPPILQYGTPLVGVVLFFIAYKIWSLGVGKYQSTGS